jgi:hypothetical protein
MTAADPGAPDAAAVAAYILETFEGVDTVTAGRATFFSIDPEKHRPNFATIVTTDEFDDFSDLDHPGVYRLNIGVGRATFDALVRPGSNHDLTVGDRVFPHPVYAKQRWVSVIDPSRATFDDVVKPLLDEAYRILADRKARRPTSD